MTDQPTPGKDDTPRGEQPPLDTPPYGTPRAAWAAGSSSEPGYGQGQDQAYGPDGRQHGAWQDQPYGGQAYGQPGTGYNAYGQPAQQYAAPGQPAPGYNAYGQPSYYGVPAQPKALSIASLCCGTAALVGFGFFLLPQIAAVILGHMALSREPAGRGMAIAGLVLGYVGVAITILVIVIFGIVISSARYTGYGI